MYTQLTHAVAKRKPEKIQAVNVDRAQELTGMGKRSTGQLTVRHVFIKETSFLPESKHIYFIINLSLAFLSRCFCSFYLVSKRFTIEFAMCQADCYLREGHLHDIGNHFLVKLDKYNAILLLLNYCYYFLPVYRKLIFCTVIMVQLICITMST